MTLSYTPLRHKMLAEVAESRIFRFHLSWERDDGDPRLLSTEARSVTGLDEAELLRYGARDESGLQSMALTSAGAALLSSWDAQYGEVKP